MTIVLILFGLILVGVSARLVAHAIAIPRLQLRVHLREIRDYGFVGERETEGHQSRKRLNESIALLAERIGRFGMRAIPRLSPLKRGELTAAGFYDTTVEVVHGYRLLAAAFLPSLIILFMASNGGFSLLTLVVICGATALGWVMPAMIIRSRGSGRLDEMDRQLPEVIDLLTATVEAGMGFAGSLNLVANRFRGALGDELRLTLSQQSLGISNQRSLEDMIERCDTPSVRAFVRTVIRAESLGSSIGPVLRELAQDMRRRRRQTAKEKMQKAPVKMIFPLMFLIFPALMVVIMYPAAYAVLHNLTSVG
jgi:tight adherence protein C